MKGEWVFPNPFVESIRRTAELRGQHRNRLELRDAAWKLPSARIVRATGMCPVTYGVFLHEKALGWSYCKHCGSLIEG